jgi:hypothetical protein
MINNSVLKDLDSTIFNHYLNQTPITLTFRSSRFVREKNSFYRSFIAILRLNRTTDISQAICSRKLTSPTVKNKKEDDQFSRPITNVLDTNNEQQSSIIPRSNTQQIKKAILELIETERAYVHVST